MSFIKEYKNALSLSLCNSIIEKLEEENCLHQGKNADNELNLEVKKTFDFHIDIEVIQKNEFWKNMNKTLMDMSVMYMNKYLFEYIGPEILQSKSVEQTKRRLGSMFREGLRISGIQIQKYTPGCYFKPHVDDVPEGPRRMVAGIIYLNDVDINDGGSTRFYNGHEIQPEMGKILFFPSTWTYLHQGTELKKGLKYIITIFAISTTTET